MQTLAHHSRRWHPIEPRCKGILGWWRLARISLLLLVLSLGTSPGNCEGIYMLIGGMAGESKAPGHTGWIEVFGMSHGLYRLPPAAPVHQEMSFIKRLDSTTPLLYDSLDNGTIIPTVQIEFTSDSPGFLLFYKINLSSVHLSSVYDSASAGAGDAAESVSLFYDQIAWSYTQVGAPGSPISTATWNLTTTNGTYSTGLTDTDGDGMPDAYELANGLNPNVNDANDDPDHDGLTNYQEFLAGTNPHDFNSVFRVSRINLASGLVRITWNSVAGKTYTIRAANQVGGSYTPVRNVASAGNGETFADFTPSASSQFYRVSTP